MHKKRKTTKKVRQTQIPRETKRNKDTDWQTLTNTNTIRETVIHTDRNGRWARKPLCREFQAVEIPLEITDNHHSQGAHATQTS